MLIFQNNPLQSSVNVEALLAILRSLTENKQSNTLDAGQTLGQSLNLKHQFPQYPISVTQESAFQQANEESYPATDKKRDESVLRKVHKQPTDGVRLYSLQRNDKYDQSASFARDTRQDKLFFRNLRQPESVTSDNYSLFDRIPIARIPWERISSDSTIQQGSFARDSRTQKSPIYSTFLRNAATEDKDANSSSQPNDECKGLWCKVTPEMLERVLKSMIADYVSQLHNDGEEYRDDNTGKYRDDNTGKCRDGNTGKCKDDSSWEMWIEQYR